MKKVIAFDLDGTLAPSKSPLPEPMSGLISRLLDNFQVCVISGGKIEQFHKQLLDGLDARPEQLAKLHLMPTCGTRYYDYVKDKNDWNQVYAEDFKPEETQKIIDALNKGFDDLGYREEKVYGETIEDRGSQVTFSVLGQDIVDVLGEEGVHIKENWDVGDVKKQELRDYIAPLIPEFEVRVGGVTSIDVTKKGIDKAYGMKKLTEILGISPDDILFMGDRLYEGGNDYPVKAAGIDCIAVKSWEDTAMALRGILYVV
jgi:phosphomannomutase